MRAETFALFFGVAYLSAGLLGLHPAALTPAPADAPPLQLSLLYGYLLGVFPVNALLSALHVATGVWGILAWRRLTSPRIFVRTCAVAYGALAVMGFLPRLDTLFGVMPLHGHNVWLHAVTAAVAAYVTWRPELSVEHRASDLPDRRQSAVPVPQERRVGHPDRRLPSATEEI
jgi:uncharacterized protein DUF4383